MMAARSIKAARATAAVADMHGRFSYCGRANKSSLGHRPSGTLMDTCHPANPFPLALDRLGVQAAATSNLSCCCPILYTRVRLRISHNLHNEMKIRSQIVKAAVY